mgnify:FL=1
MADHRTALDGLSQLTTDVDKYRGYVNEYRDILNECFEIVEALYKEKSEEYAFMQLLTGSTMTVDGVKSTDACVLCPLTEGDVLPEYPLQHVKYFDMKE